jgi:hypothetical protein
MKLAPETGTGPAVCCRFHRQVASMVGIGGMLGPVGSANFAYSKSHVLSREMQVLL